MSKHSRTDDGAFNSLRFNKIDFHKERIASQKAAEKEKAERMAAILACIEADEKKLKEAAHVKASKSADTHTEAVRFSGSKAEYFRNSLVSNE